MPCKQQRVSWNFFLQLIILVFFSFPQLSLPPAYSTALSISILPDLYTYAICPQIYICVNICINLCVSACVCLCIPTDFWDFSYNLVCFNEGVFKLTYPLWCQPENSRDTFFWERSPSTSIRWQLLLQLLQYVRFFILKVQGHFCKAVTPFSPTVS